MKVHLRTEDMRSACGAGALVTPFAKLVTCARCMRTQAYDLAHVKKAAARALALAKGLGMTLTSDENEHPP